VYDDDDNVYEWIADDGRCVWFNVSVAHRIADKQPIAWQIETSNIAESPEALLERHDQLDTAYAMTTDLSQPVLGVFFEGAWLLIDGNHRAYRALREEVKTLNAYLLEVPAEVEQCIIAIFTPEETKQLQEGGGR
jgi:hypothetical protein